MEQSSETTSRSMTSEQDFPEVLELQPGQDIFLQLSDRAAIDLGVRPGFRAATLCYGTFKRIGLRGTELVIIIEEPSFGCAAAPGEGFGAALHCLTPENYPKTVVIPLSGISVTGEDVFEWIT